MAQRGPSAARSADPRHARMRGRAGLGRAGPGRRRFSILTAMALGQGGIAPIPSHPIPSNPIPFPALLPPLAPEGALPAGLGGRAVPVASPHCRAY